MRGKKLERKINERNAKIEARKMDCFMYAIVTPMEKKKKKKNFFMCLFSKGDEPLRMCGMDGLMQELHSSFSGFEAALMAQLNVCCTRKLQERKSTK